MNAGHRRRSATGPLVHPLAARGIAVDRLARLTCPIDQTGVGGRVTEVIALAVLAQLLALAG